MSWAVLPLFAEPGGGGGGRRAEGGKQRSKFSGGVEAAAMMLNSGAHTVPMLPPPVVLTGLRRGELARAPPPGRVAGRRKSLGGAGSPGGGGAGGGGAAMLGYLTLRLQRGVPEEMQRLEESMSARRHADEEEHRPASVDHLDNLGVPEAAWARHEPPAPPPARHGGEGFLLVVDGARYLPDNPYPYPHPYPYR